MDKSKNIVEQLIGVLTTPIAQRNGVHLTKEDCEVWAEELENFLHEQTKQTDTKSYCARGKFHALETI